MLSQVYKKVYRFQCCDIFCWTPSIPMLMLVLISAVMLVVFILFSIRYAFILFLAAWHVFATLFCSKFERSIVFLYEKTLRRSLSRNIKKRERSVGAELFPPFVSTFLYHAADFWALCERLCNISTFCSYIYLFIYFYSRNNWKSLQIKCWIISS